MDDEISCIAEFVQIAFVEMAQYQIKQDDPDMSCFHDLFDLYAGDISYEGESK